MELPSFSLVVLCQHEAGDRQRFVAARFGIPQRVVAEALDGLHERLDLLGTAQFISRIPCAESSELHHCLLPLVIPACDQRDERHQITYARFRNPRDIRAAVSQLPQHLVGMLPEHWRRAIHARSVMCELERSHWNGERTVDPWRTLVPMQHTARGNLRISQRLAHRAHARGRNMALLQPHLPLRRTARQHDLAEQLLFAIVIGVGVRRWYA